MGVARPDNVLGQLGRADGLRRGQFVCGVKDIDKYGGTRTRGGSIFGGGEGREGVSMLREMRDRIPLPMYQAGKRGDLSVGEKWHRFSSMMWTGS